MELVLNSPTTWKKQGVENTYIVTRSLFSGRYGQVVLATDAFYHNSVVLKFPANSSDPRSLYSIYHEYRMNVMMHSWELHPDIPLLLTVDSNIVDIENKITTDASDPWIAYEYSTYGDLLQYILDGNKILSHTQIQNVAYDLALALKALHQHGYLHNDIKLENILITSANDDDDDSIRIKLIDHAMMSIPNLTPRAGTTSYISPERFYRNYPWEITTKSDMWSFGILLAFLMNVEDLVDDQDNPKVWFTYLAEASYHELYRIAPHLYQKNYQKSKSIDEIVGCSSKSRIEYRNSCKLEPDEDDCLCDLILRCLTFDPTKRISAAEVLNHEYVLFPIRYYFDINL